MRTMSNNPEEHTMKKTVPFIYALLFLIGFAVPFSALAENFEYKTTLVIKETKTYTPPTPTPPDPACGGITVGTPVNQPPSAPYDVYRILATPADFSKVSFRVFKTDDLNTTVYPFLGNDPGDVNFNSTTGEISFTLSGIATSRKSYTVRVYLNNDGSGTPYESKEFYTSQANTAPPVGTIIPYYGTAASAATLNLGGWFLCDGTSIASISSDILFDDEKSTLQGIINSPNLPDLRGLFLRGIDPNGTNDPSANRGIGNIQSSSVAGHTHDYDKAVSVQNTNVTLNQATVGVSTTTSDVTVLTNGTSLGGGNHSHSLNYSTVQTTSSGGGGTDNRPVNAAVNYLIKVRK